MTEQEAVSYIETYTWSATRLGLDRTRELLSRLGDPQKKLKFVHVAGSNGKGSACAMLESILRRAGYRTGLYTSPHLRNFRERIQIDGQLIPPEELGRVTEAVRDAAEAMDDHPSQFELATALAMLYFARRRCDIVVLEVGMGGALDSTNAIDAPEVALIMDIGLEHTQYLGNTIEEIAAAKAGIIKPGCICVRAGCGPGAAEVIDAACRDAGAELHRTDYSQLWPMSRDWDFQKFLWQGRAYTLPLLGDHQLRNAAAVLTAVEALRGRGWRITDAAVELGLREVRWPARFQVLGQRPLFILDGAHNPQCAWALAELLKKYLIGRRLLFVMGVLADKDWRGMVDAVAPCAGKFICTAPVSARALAPDSLADYIRSLGMEAQSFGTVEEAVHAALEEELPVVAFGSLYMAGDILSSYTFYSKKRMRKLCREQREALGGEKRARYSREICRRLMELPQVREAGVILSYVAVGSEADLSEFNDWVVSQGKRLALPFSGEEGVMEALVPRDRGGMGVDVYGIPAPAPELSQTLEPEEVDVVVVPCVGFDDRGGRLGHGGGYYDRYLPRCPRAFSVLAAFEAQRLDFLPQEDSDRGTDAAVTERETVFF